LGDILLLSPRHFHFVKVWLVALLILCTLLAIVLLVAPQWTILISSKCLGEAPSERCATARSPGHLGPCSGTATSGDQCRGRGGAAALMQRVEGDSAVSAHDVAHEAYHLVRRSPRVRR